MKLRTEPTIFFSTFLLNVGHFGITVNRIAFCLHKTNRNDCNFFLYVIGTVCTFTLCFGVNKIHGRADTPIGMIYYPDTLLSGQSVS